MSEIVKLEIDPTQYGLEKTEAEQIQAVFVPMLNRLKELEDEYNGIVSKPITPELVGLAKATRLKLVKVRTGTAEIHKKAKAYYLAGGRAVDGLKNTMLFAIEGKEEELEKIENHYVNIEKERIRLLNEERINLVSSFGVDGSVMGLGNMTDAVWENYFCGVKLAYEAKIKAEREAEDARLAAIEAERIRQEEIAAENKRLKEEAEKQAAILEAERKKADEERKKAEAERLESERIANEKIEAEKKKAEEARKKAEEEANKKLEEERQKAAALEAELKAKREAEEKAAAEIAKQEAEKRKAAEKLAKAGDKAQLKVWVDSMVIHGIGTEKMKPESVELANEIIGKFESFKAWAKTKIESL